MTENKMPDVIWAATYEDQIIENEWRDTKITGSEKYLRAEPVKALLKQARDEMGHMVDSEYIPYGNNIAFKKLIANIDKFLGEIK